MNFKSMIMIGTLLMLITSVGVMGFLSYTVWNSKPYAFVNAGAATAATPLVTTKGTAGSDIWATHKITFAVPTVLNLIGAVLLGLLVYTGK